MSAGSSTRGEVVVTTVVRPCRAARRPAAMAASVCASTAEVGSTAISTSGSASNARARRRRWRWPPERLRPWASTAESSPSGRPRTTSCARAACTAASTASSARSDRPARRSRSGPANKSASLSATRIRSRTWSRAMPASGRPPQVASESVNRPSRSTTRAVREVSSPASAVSTPGATSTPEAGSRSTDGAAGAGAPDAGSAHAGSRARKRMIRRAATSPAVTSVPASMKNATGPARTMTYP